MDTETEESETSWQEFVNQYYGILVDDPIERPDDLLPEVREQIE
jgi:hypothetical protein